MRCVLLLAAAAALSACGAANVDDDETARVHWASMELTRTRNMTAPPCYIDIDTAGYWINKHPYARPNAMDV